MANVPNTSTFSLKDVCCCGSINSTNLVGLFGAAISGFFDPTYSGSKNSLYNFRNYSPSSIPVITLVGAGIITIVQYNSYTEYGATAYDAIDGDITGSIVATGAVNTNTTGTYYRYYNVTNSGGVSAVQVVRTIIVTAAAATIVCMYGHAEYLSPPYYPPIVLTNAGGYSQSCLVSMGAAVSGTSALSSICFVNTAYKVTVYDNGYPSTNVDYSGQCFVIINTCPKNNNFNFYCFPDTTVINDKIRSLCVELI